MNTATITASPVPDPNPANDTSTDADTMAPLDADLSVVKTDSADPVLPGDSFSYTIVVTNAGPDDARDVALTDTVPGVLTISAVTSSGTGVCLTTGQTIVCGIDPLVAGAHLDRDGAGRRAARHAVGDRHEHGDGVRHRRHRPDERLGQPDHDDRGACGLRGPHGHEDRR